MRGMLAILMLALPIEGAQLSAAPECQERNLAVTVQIHDYVHLPSEELSRASDIVTRLYGRIGVRTEWFGALRQDIRRTHSAASQEGPRLPVAQLTIIILTPEMAARGHIAEGVLGFAAVPEEGMGRIAYVIYDRVRQVAAEGGASEVELLGFVMAHEAGHLLLGRGAESQNGLMKNHWERRDLQQVDALTLGFSDLQASQIHRNLENNPTPSAAVATSGSGAVDACATMSPGDEIAHDRLPSSAGPASDVQGTPLVH